MPGRLGKTGRPERGIAARFDTRGGARADEHSEANQPVKEANPEHVLLTREENWIA